MFSYANNSKNGDREYLWTYDLDMCMPINLFQGQCPRDIPNKSNQKKPFLKQGLYTYMILFVQQRTGLKITCAMYVFLKTESNVLRENQFCLLCHWDFSHGSNKILSEILL